METDEKAPEKSEKEEKAPQPFLTKKCEKISDEFEIFFRLQSLGDLNAIYRNRGCFVNEKNQSALVTPIYSVFAEFPAARPSIYYYTGLLIHECVHYWFNQKEKVAQTTDISIVQGAANEILDFYIKTFAENSGKGALEEILQWLCELSAELSLKNAGRPAMAHAQQNGEILTILKSNETIEKMLSLMNMIVTTTLNENPDGCMKALFESSRHGQHFSWIWLHIATFLQGSIITHLLDSGADQFRIFVQEFTNRNATGGAPAVLNIIQTEYEHKFRAISDVFNFLMGKRNPELQDAVSQLIVDSLDIKVENPAAGNVASSRNRLGFAFFFKLVTCSLKTLQILVNSNCHLITPFNVVRAIRHVQAVDQAVILPLGTYTDFVRSIVGDVDPITHGIIFELLIELVYNPNVFSGENVPELQESNLQITLDCYPVLDVMIDRIVRVAHSAGGNKCPSLHPAIQLYSSGEKLQFIIDSIAIHPEKNSSIIRHLHAIAIAFDEGKAAEIALRFLMTIKVNQTDSMYSFMSFLQCTVPFYPKLMVHMWREFEGLRTFIQESFNVEDPRRWDKIGIHRNLLRNIDLILNWEFWFGKGPQTDVYPYWELYPGEHIGSILKYLLTESNRHCHELINAGKIHDAMNIYRMVTVLIESIRLSNAAQRDKKPVLNRRFIYMKVSEMYKLMATVSIMLKTSLMLVGKSNPDGVVVFEELRGKFLYLIFGNHLDPKLARFTPLFLNFFVTACFIDAKKLFHDRIGETMETLIDESGLNKLTDLVQLEDGPSILDGLRSLNMRDSAVEMLHKGQLKRRRKGDPIENEGDDEDAMQRIHVLIDVTNLMCFSQNTTISLECSKQLAVALVQAVCRDSLMMDMRFDDWDSEAEFIHRHVEITQRLNQSPLCDGLLRIMSESRSFGYCLPIMKSQLAILLNETEKFPEHKTIPEAIRRKLHYWVLLAHRGGILPARFSYICDLEHFATCHETHLMLVEIWRFFQFRNITLETVDTYHNDLLRNTIDEGLPNEKEALEKVNISVFRIIIQNHLPATVSLFPKIFPADYESLKLARIE